MRNISQSTLGILATASVLIGAGAHAAERQSELAGVVNAIAVPLMAKNNIPGMAIAVTVGGKHYTYNYGVASKASGQKVTDATLFEIGSVSKTFTATLAGYAQASGDLSFTDSPDKYLPELAASRLAGATMLDLGTYTAGGLPLQFPDDVTDHKAMVGYYKSWKPAYAPGTYRVYSNPSIGLFGYAAAKAMGWPFDDLMQQKLFLALGLSHTFIAVPKADDENYAYGYSKAGKAIRVSPGVLDSEAYGVKMSASDMLRFVEANMDGSDLDKTMQSALAATHTGYYRIGSMTQGLGWEMYKYPTTLDQLLAGNSADMTLKANEIEKLSPPRPPAKDMLLNKTGSTNGFGAYVAFVPSKSIGIVLFANKNYPNSERVKAAYKILATLDDDLPAANAD
ncbi:class C beta-lactamase [Rhizobium grahamii]|uniref:Beta-lactamase n=2 Tax=Rhizobium grahamii TaxID=1120045 RepID=S3H8K4_9HYPH|nr:class C beta-lactamase [Rhizobium grahamii]EPE94535.1 beta-lactamase [Rhizobium grahamii CCGE 502]RDJ06405.1 class C beta-lactamase [Rhizobium grahamii]